MAELISSATRSLFAAGGINPWPNPYHHEDMGCGGMTPTGECFSTEWWCDPSYGLSDAGYGYCFVEATGGYLVVGVEKKQAWLHSRGTPGEKIGAQVCQWIAFSIAIALLTFYGFSAWKATCGWEEVYVCCVEVLFVTLEIFKEFSSPATVYLSTGNHAYCLRYFEWLLSCPVILIKLSNLSGLKNDYSKRTMGLIVSCVGMIVFGMAAGLATDWLKWLLYIVSCIYGGYMYFQAAKCYVEANHSVPKGHCRMVVKLMAYAYFASWGSYPILWAVGPEGLLKLSPYANSIGHSICDIIAKEFWTFLAHHLRIKIHEHILIHGDIRKTTKMEIGGEEVEVEEFVEEEDEDTVTHPTSNLANRNSFVIMAERMRARGIDVRASLDRNGPMIESGRVILADTDIFVTEMFKAQFAQLPAAIELIPALGADNALQLVQQASVLGGCDFVMVHPQFLKDNSPSGLVARLRMMGQRVVAFGPANLRELIESCDVDAWIEAPPINLYQLRQVVAQMQLMRRQAAMMGGMGGGMKGGMSGMGMHAGSIWKQQQMMMQQDGSAMMMPAMQGGAASMRGSGLISAQPGRQASLGGPQSVMMGSAMVGSNPLFGTAPSPLGSAVGAEAMGHNLYGNQAAAGGIPAASAAADGTDVEMMQQLMSEIDRLKGELGEQD